MSPALAFSELEAGRHTLMNPVVFPATMTVQEIRHRLEIPVADVCGILNRRNPWRSRELQAKQTRRLQHAVELVHDKDALVRGHMRDEVLGQDLLEAVVRK